MTSSTQLITMVVIMLSINIAMASFQNGVLELNPSAGFDFNLTDSPMNQYGVNNELTAGAELIPDNAQVEQETNFFQDNWNLMKSWTQDKLKSVSFITDLLAQPYGFLRTIGLPDAISFGVGLLWYMVALITFVSWLAGR
jgi:hypothetical protein